MFLCIAIIPTSNKDATSNKCHATSNKCLSSSNKKLVETSLCQDFWERCHFLLHLIGSFGENWLFWRACHKQYCKLGSIGTYLLENYIYDKPAEAVFGVLHKLDRFKQLSKCQCEHESM